MYEHILVGVDGSDHAKTAASHAIQIASQSGATLHALYAIETRTAYDNAIVDREKRERALREEGEAALQEVEQLAGEAGVDVTTTVTEGVPGEEIIAYIDEEGIDIVCLGERGQSDFKTLLLGSTTETVIHNTDIPVVVV